MTNSEKLRNACEDAVATFTKISDEKFSKLQADLEYCIGSYDHDKNPSGLEKYGKEALKTLTAYKVQKPRKVTKKVLVGLEKGLV